MFVIATRIVVVLTILPLLAAVGGSFTADGATGYGWWWGTSRGWSLLGRTLALALSAAAIGTVVGWIIARAAASGTRPVAIVLLTVACIPLILPSSLLGVAWIMALGRDGWITDSLRRAAGDWPWTVYQLPVAAALIGLRYAGLAALILAPECRRQRALGPVERAFRIPPARRLLHLRLRPAISPIVASLVLLSILCANDHILPSMFLISTYGVQVLIQYNALLDPAGAAALAMPMVALGLLVIAHLGVRSASPETTEQRGELSALAQPSTGPPFAAMAIVLASVGVPFAALSVRAGSWSAIVDGWSASADERWRTLGLALASGAVCAMLAIAPAAHWVACRRSGRPSLAPMALLVVFVPPSLLALGVIALFERPLLRSFRDGDAPLLVAYACRFLPVAIIALVAGWRRISPSVLEAARVHGVSGWRTVVWLIVPLHGRAVVSAAALCALLVATELELSLMLAPPGATTLGVRLYSMMHTAPDALVSAAALSVAGIALLPAVLVAVILSRTWSARPWIN